MLPILLVIFIPVFGLVLASALLLNRHLSGRHRIAMTGALREARPPIQRALMPILMAPGKIAFSGLLASVNIGGKVSVLIQQAGVSWTAKGVISCMAGCAAAGALLGSRLQAFATPALGAAVLGTALGGLPLIPLLAKRRKRLQDFERQLPDALDFLARAMRAGHAFSTSVKIMADESPDPLGPEFRKMCVEFNLGAPLPTALEALMTRVPLVDLQFFSAAVTLQRQTGGNIGEVMLRLSQVIRERFALRGKVRATSAHGRLTGFVLAAMPVAVALFLMLTSPDYLRLLLKDPLGRYLILAAVTGQVLGYFCIRKIVSFEV